MHHFDTDGPLPEIPFDTVTKIQEVLDAGGIDLDLEDLTPAELESKARAYNVFAHLLQMLHDPAGHHPDSGDILIPINRRWSTPLADALNWHDLRSGVSDNDAHRETLLIAHLLGFLMPSNMAATVVSDMLMGFLITDDLGNPAYEIDVPHLDHKLDSLMDVLDPIFSGAHLQQGWEQDGQRQTDAIRVEARLAGIGYAVENVAGTGTFVRSGAQSSLTPVS